MFKKYMVGRKNVDISLLWAAKPSTLRTTGLGYAPPTVGSSLSCVHVLYGHYLTLQQIVCVIIWHINLSMVSTLYRKTHLDT